MPIAVGMRAGSHFNVPYRLESILPLEHIKTVNIGGFGARLTALLTGEVEATSLLDPQISMADQLGLRRVIGNTFKTLWVVPQGADRAVLDAYFRVLQRADADLDQDPPAACPCGATAFRPSFRIVSGISPASTWASGSSTRQSSARNSTNSCKPPSAGASTTTWRRARSRISRCRSSYVAVRNGLSGCQLTQDGLVFS